MKKKTVIMIVIAALVLLGSSGVYATGQIARSNAISEDDAINFACVDAGVLPEEITLTDVDFDFEHGRFVYEIEFYVNGTEYDYVIDSSNGEILDKDIEISHGNKYDGAGSGNNSSTKPTGGSSQGGQVQANPSDFIGIESAKDIALASSGFKESDIVFSKAKLDREDGRVVYDIEFYVYDKAEYGYEIDAVTGKILEEGFETWEQEDYIKYENAAGSAANNNSSSKPAASNSTSGSSSSTNSNSTSTSNSKPATSSSSSSSTTSNSTSTSNNKPATSSSSSSSSSSTTSNSTSTSSSKPATSSSTSSKPATSSSTSSSSSSNSTSTSSSKPATSSSSSGSSSSTNSSSSTSNSKPATSSSSSSSSSAAPAPTPAPAPAPAEPSTISVEQAKSIAFSYAGVSGGSVVLEKAKLDKEDGTLVYEIEFYIPGKAEYEVEIDAYSGAVLDYDFDYDDDWDDDDDDWDDD